MIDMAKNYEADPVSSDLRRSYEANDLRPLWEAEDMPALERAHIWMWDKIRPIMAETAKITLPAIIERRVLEFVNPSSRAGATSGVINATIQALMPGEHARPHRHSMHALRFVVDGGGAETIVDGKPCKMEPGDLILTPGWTWHEHRNVDGGPTYWIDILDVTLQRSLGTAAFQAGPIVEPRATISDAAFTSSAFLPTAATSQKLGYSPLFRYPWDEAKAAVAAAPPASDGSRTVRYADPVTGGAVMPTLDCYLTLLDEGGETDIAKSNASSVCVIMAGEGETVVGDETVRWGPRDVVAIPAGAWARQRCIEGAALIFVASSREIYQRLSMLVEEQSAA